MRYLPLLVVCALPAAADDRRWDAKTLFDAGVTRNVRLAADGIELDDGELIEDDGPAAGYSYQPNEEKLSAAVWAKKELLAPDPRAKAATLLLGPGGPVTVTINGKPIELPKPTKAGNYWEAYSIPPEVLKAGTNAVVVSGGGKLWVARADEYPPGTTHPKRSSRSPDGGKTWEPVAGEFYVRLFLHRFRPAGSLTLPVFDLGNLSGRVVAPPLSAVGPIKLELHADGTVAVKVRTGPTPTPGATTWSDWTDLGRGGEVHEPRGRFAEVSIALVTDDPLRTPAVKGLRITTQPNNTVPDWTAALKVVESRNAEIVRTSAPFRYEPFDHPKLKQIREQFKLDEVVGGATDELELVSRLAKWSSVQWKKGHLKDVYPAWDALAILKPHADGTPVGGFCQQYNLVFLQACESFGVPGRAVSIGPGDRFPAKGGGHEVVEVWLNRFNKWVYIDGNEAWYFTDAKTGEPLSLRELRERQLPMRAGKPFDAVKLVRIADGRAWESLADWPPFAELRLVPRSNFLEQAAPLPLNQGMRGWFWTGHHVWTDAASPAGLLYGNRVSDRKNWDWTLNQARYTLEPVADGELRVHLETVSPGFDTFVAETDGGKPTPVASGFAWKLHPGRNVLVVRARNVAGRIGPPSRVVIDRP